MRHIMRNATLALALALGLCATESATVQDGKRPPSRHAAAVKKCRDDYDAARRAAKNMTGQAQQTALAAAQRNYDDCIKEASKVVN